MPEGKKRSAEEKHPRELTDNEALEHLFSKEVRDEAKRVAQKAQKADMNRESSSHK